MCVCVCERHDVHACWRSRSPGHRGSFLFHEERVPGNASAFCTLTGNWRFPRSVFFFLFSSSILLSTNDYTCRSDGWWLMVRGSANFARIRLWILFHRANRQKGFFFFRERKRERERKKFNSFHRKFNFFFDSVKCWIFFLLSGFPTFLIVKWQGMWIFERNSFHGKRQRGNIF